MTVVVPLEAPRTLVLRQAPTPESGRRRWLLELELDVDVLDPDEILAGSEGFLVDAADGRELGVVEAIETVPDGAVSALVVAGGWFGRRRLRVPVEAIETILPAERRIVARA